MQDVSGPRCPGRQRSIRGSYARLMSSYCAVAYSKIWISGQLAHFSCSLNLDPHDGSQL